MAECDSIARISTTMMESLRGTLFRLRPPDVEELGLAASLEGLVSGWNGRNRGTPRFEIALEGTLDRLPLAIGADLYRIAQEAITNAAKHAHAMRIILRLEATETDIVLSVTDDGPAQDEAARPGMGLLGMRERVAILGGRLSVASGVSGTVLRATIPVAAEVATGPQTERAA
jgi:signal transduction histidine kinase